MLPNYLQSGRSNNTPRSQTQGAGEAGTDHPADDCCASLSDAFLRHLAVHDYASVLATLAREGGWDHSCLAAACHRAVVLGIIPPHLVDSILVAHVAGTTGPSLPVEHLLGHQGPVLAGLVPTAIEVPVPMLQRQTTGNYLVGTFRKYTPVLNGNNGSWTNSDDVKRSQRKNKAKQKAVVLSGHGDYTAVVKKVSQAAAKAATQKLADSMGVPSAGPAIYRGVSALGEGMVRRIRGIFKGRGDYLIQPAKMNSLFPGTIPRGQMGGFGPLVGDACIEIKLTEALFTVYTSSTPGAYVNYAVYINPANPLFQFLTTLGSSFEYIEWLGLVFEFESTCSPYVTGSALGTVISGMEYNPTNPLYTTASRIVAMSFCEPRSWTRVLSS